MRGVAIAHNNEEPRNNNKSNRYFGSDNNAQWQIIITHIDEGE